MKLRYLMIIVVFLVGCTASSPPVKTENIIISTKKYPAHNRQVWVLKGKLPEVYKYEVLEVTDIEKVWFDSDKEAFKKMAKRARALGGDAVIDAKTWKQPSGWTWNVPVGGGDAQKINVEFDEFVNWSWSAPHAKGQIVKITTWGNQYLRKNGKQY